MVELEKWVRGIRDIHFSFHEHLGNYHVPGRALAECTKMKIRTGSLQGSYRPVECRRPSKQLYEVGRKATREVWTGFKEGTDEGRLRLLGGAEESVGNRLLFSRPRPSPPPRPHRLSSAPKQLPRSLLRPPVCCFRFFIHVAARAIFQKADLPDRVISPTSRPPITFLTTYPQPGFSGGTGLGFYL